LKLQVFECIKTFVFHENFTKAFEYVLILATTNKFYLVFIPKLSHFITNKKN